MTSLAFHADQLFSPIPGGIGTYVRRLVPALHAAAPDLRISLFHARFAQSAPPERWMSEFPVEEIPGGIRSLYPQWALRGAPALPSRIAAMDLLHAPSPAAIPPPGSRQRLVVTVHDLAFLVQPEAFPRRWRLMYRAGLRRAVAKADALITVSRSTADDLLLHTRAEPARVYSIPLAASLPPSSTRVEEVLAKFRVQPPYVLFNGTLEPRKNLVRLVRAYRRVVAAGAGHALVLAGALGWRPEPLLAEVRGEAPGSVVLTGRVSAAELDALYRGATAFVYPSLYEGFGLPVLDAMARGIPCVVSSAGSLPEVAGEAAIPVDPRSVGAIADALKRLLADAALAARLRDAGLDRAAGFSWEETARRTLAVYRSVL